MAKKSQPDEPQGPSGPQKLPVTRKLRTDARRNRERILQVAKEAFTETGPDVSMDEIARRAVVGPGTLYRHFPTRDVLLESVYRTEVGKLAAAERTFARSLSPVEALRAWLYLFVDYMAAKQIIAPALNMMAGGPAKMFESTGAQVKAAIDALVGRAVGSGEFRADVEPLDLLRAIVGVTNVASTPDWPQSAKRMVDILILGSRPAKS